MATNKWNNNAPSFGYDAWTGTANLGVNLARQKNAPLDISCVFSSKIDMLYYVTEGRFPAKGVGVSDKVKDMTKYPYLGQIIALVDTETEDVQIFYIQTAEYKAELTETNEVFEHYFTEVGKATIGDDNSISLNEGVLSLHDFGKRYYKFIPATGTESSDDYVAAHYDTNPTDGWKDGLEPAVVDGKLVWREKNTSTVDGLVDEFEKIRKNAAIRNEDNKFTKNNDFTEGTISVPVPTQDSHAVPKSYLEQTINGLGSVFTFKGVLTETEFNTANQNLNDKSKNTYKVGDVVLVTIETGAADDNINKEYVVVNRGTAKDPSLSFEMFGDPHGVTSLQTEVNDLKTADEQINKEIDDLKTVDEKINKEIDDLKAVDEQINEEIGGLKESKADKADVYTKTETDDKIQPIIDDIGKDETANTIKGRIKTLETNVDDVESTVTTHTDKITLLETAVGASGTVANATNADIAKTAQKIANPISVFGKQFDGSEAGQKIETADIKATNEKLGFVKGGTGVGKVSVDVDGTMSVDKVAGAETADKTKASLKFGEKTFDGSAAQTIEASDLGINPTEYAKEAEVVKGVKIAGQTAKVVENIAEITTDEIKSGLGLGTAAYKNADDFATPDDISALDDSVVKLTEDQTVDGNKTFAKPIVVPKPTADTHATNKAYVDEEIKAKMSAIDSMTFKGLLGNEENATLPISNVKNGDTYKVVKDGKYAEQEAKVGDIFIALVKNASEAESNVSWVLVPSGDDGNVVADKNLEEGQLVVGGGEKDLKTLSANTNDNGKVLGIVDGKPSWNTITSEDKSVEINTKKVEENGVIDLSIAKVNVDKLEQKEGTYIIFNCGSATEVI